jgi:alkylated DNA repair protein alkB family protein 8
MLKNHIEKSEKTWDTIAKSFDSTRNKPWKQCIDFIQTLSKNDIVADIGCGNGRHLIPAAYICKKVFGLDLSKELLRIVKNKLITNKIKNTTLIHSNIVQLPIKKESVDSVLFIATLHNIQDRERRIQSLKEINRILKKNGKAIISVWSRWQDKYRKQFLKKWFTNIENSEFGDIDIYWRQHGLNIPRFYHLYSKREFSSDLKKSDLNIMDIQGVKIRSKKHPDNYFAIVTR